MPASGKSTINAKSTSDKDRQAEKENQMKKVFLIIALIFIATNVQATNYQQCTKACEIEDFDCVDICFNELNK